MSEKKILLAIRGTTQYSRNVLQGVISAARWHSDWRLVNPVGGFFYPEAAQPRDIAGVLCLETESRKWDAQGIPVVNVVSRPSGGSHVCVTTDHQEIGQLAGQHLHSANFQHFAACGYRNLPFSQQRIAGFADFLRPLGYRPHLRLVPGWSSDAKAWRESRRKGLSWLKSLPLPCGVFCVDDSLGCELLDLARELGLDVPHELSVLGVDNDELLCSLARPQLSSIAIPDIAIGHRSVELLASWMKRGKVPGSETVRGAYVRTRGSSGVSATSDPSVQKALRHLHSRTSEPVSVPELASAAGVCRRTLENRFISALGRTPFQEITRVRIERIRFLLTTSSDSLESIAAATGLRNAAEVCAVFRRETGVTPGHYRKTFRNHSPDQGFQI